MKAPSSCVGLALGSLFALINAVLADEKTVEVTKSDFRPIAQDVSYEGRDLFELAIRAGMYQRKGREYLPGVERDALSAGGFTWHGSNGAGLVAYAPHMRRYSIYYLQKQAVPGHHLSLHHANEDYVFFSYGWHPDLPAVESALEVYSLKRRCFARVERVSTHEAKLGAFSVEVLRRHRSGISGEPSMGWNDRGHSGKRWVTIRNTAYFAHPEQVVLVDGMYRLYFHRSWNISEFETVLRFRKSDLDAEVEKLASNKADGASLH